MKHLFTLLLIIIPLFVLSGYKDKDIVETERYSVSMVYSNSSDNEYYPEGLLDITDSSFNFITPHHITILKKVQKTSDQMWNGERTVYYNCTVCDNEYRVRLFYSEEGELENVKIAKGYGFIGDTNTIVLLINRVYIFTT